MNGGVKGGREFSEVSSDREENKKKKQLLVLKVPMFDQLLVP